MKQALIAWLCIFAAIGCFRCANLHTAERTDNILIGTQHQLALDKCLNTAVATYHITQDYSKANDQYMACANDVDRKYAP